MKFYRTGYGNHFEGEYDSDYYTDLADASEEYGGSGSVILNRQ